MNVLTAAINELQKQALTTGLSKEAIAHAGMFAALTYIRSEVLNEEKILKEAQRVVPFRYQMESITTVEPS